MESVHRVIHRYIRASEYNIVWTKPKFRSETDEYFDNPYAQRYLAELGLDFQNKKQLFKFLGKGSHKTLTKKQLGKCFNFTLDDSDFDRVIRDPKLGESYKSMEADLKSNGSIKLESPILIKAGRNYYGFSGNRRTNLGYRNNVPVNFWVVQAPHDIGGEGGGMSLPLRNAALRVIQAYNREKLKTGYKGKFVIQEHDADKAGKHWDIRIEMPKGSGSVYRSFVDKKAQLPAKGKKIFLIESEDHPMSYGEFEGKIPKGEYGAGDVKIVDKGTYELLDVEGDKKYVMNFGGKKLKGEYALIKYQDGYLWVKAN